MTRFLILPLLLLGFAASAQTTSASDNPRIGLGKPASKSRFTARLNSTPAPLYIVDGYLLESPRLNDISPDRIESINIVKGDEAVALYGEKGRGGLALITTKPPKTSR